MNFQSVSSLQGEIQIPGDKSISHRAIMFGALALGTTEIYNFLQGADCLSTIHCFQKLGIEIENLGSLIKVHGKGLHGLCASSSILDVGNSGTTARLITGILAAQPFASVLTGDESIQRRPMDRIITPLSMMGASITSHKKTRYCPLSIEGKSLTGIHYDSPVASAQVKSSILLAGLYANGTTSVTEPYVSRNHTELMLEQFGVPVITHNTTVSISTASKLYHQKIIVPGDISSAAFFMVAGLIVPNSCIRIQNVGINPTRSGILDVCIAMGANITLENKKTDIGEPTADIIVKTSNLKGTIISGEMIPRLIDEIPILAVMACFADGETIIKDAKELKVKESNRLDIIVKNLSAMGADITATDDGMIIRGGKPLHGTTIDSNNDHRIAMSFAIASLVADGVTAIQNAECVAISYPNFYHDLAYLIRT
ncbi:MAG: 3-phosphoshikimate 1-carboxyvinyltransferase [Firmicutes bacterium]|uniref:3-phosphoshikimate 1-carboxyvinyltransferase n=1 Tax=Candidatus Scybalomonas excrementavium TaxID=2840943 RepID=A0A9D9I350_9FIRM|nr:3-phosphoshikimate 1-carboxyvinyltransferase [Candidatus Scybalomonas excrementavium]